MRTDAVRAWQGLVDKVAKASADDVGRVLDAIALGRFEDMRPELEVLIRKLASERAIAAAEAAGRAAGVTGGELARMLEQANLDAIDWAQQHAADLVTEITETTRHEIRELIEAGVSSGATNDEISTALQDAFAFSKGRSTLIARTETAFAESRGTLDGWQASGVVTGKEALPDVDPCPVCLANAAQGVIPIDALFASGDSAPPFHPNCECAMTAVLSED